MGIEKKLTSSMASNMDSMADKNNDNGNGKFICEDSHSIVK